MRNHKSLQQFYDGLIGYSNTAYKNSKSQELIEIGTAPMWLSKSEQYDFIAANFAVVMSLNDVHLETVVSQRQRDLDQLTHEELIQESETEKSWEE